MNESHQFVVFILSCGIRHLQLPAIQNFNCASARSRTGSSSVPIRRGGLIYEASSKKLRWAPEREPCLARPSVVECSDVFGKDKEWKLLTGLPGEEKTDALVHLEYIGASAGELREWDLAFPWLHEVNVPDALEPLNKWLLEGEVPVPRDCPNTKDTVDSTLVGGMRRDMANYAVMISSMNQLTLMGLRASDFEYLLPQWRDILGLVSTDSKAPIQYLADIVRTEDNLRDATNLLNTFFLAWSRAMQKLYYDIPFWPKEYEM